MQSVTTVGLDIAKSVFQVHGVDADGNVVLRRQLKRRYVLAFFQKLPPCLIGIEACASSHYWSRELQALGHTVRLMPPAYVKPYVKRQKNDAADAEAICEAVTRPNMRFVPTKTPEQQSCLTLHRTRHLFIRQQTAVMLSANTLHCALELSKKSWLLAIQFPDREQPSLYAIEGGDAEKLLAKLTAARDCWAKVSGALPVITLCYEVGSDLLT